MKAEHRGEWKIRRNKFGSSFHQVGTDPFTNLGVSHVKTMGEFTGKWAIKALFLPGPFGALPYHVAKRELGVNYDANLNISQISYDLSSYPTTSGDNGFSMGTSLIRLSETQLIKGDLSIHTKTDREKLFVTFAPESANPSEIEYVRSPIRDNHDFESSAINFEDNLRILSTIYAEEGDKVFEYRADSTWDDKEISHKQLGWNNEQKQAVDATLQTILEANVVQQSLDEGLDREQREQFLKGLKRQITRVLPNELWKVVNERRELTDALIHFTGGAVELIIQEHEDARELGSTTSAHFTFLEENQIKIEITDDEYDEVFTERTVGFDEEFYFDQTKYNLSRATGKLLLATTHLGKGGQRIIHGIPIQPQPGIIANLIKSPRPDNWGVAITYLPSSKSLDS